MKDKEKIDYLPLSICGFSELPLLTLVLQKCHSVHGHFIYHVIFPLLLIFLFFFQYLLPEKTKVPLDIFTLSTVCVKRLGEDCSAQPFWPWMLVAVVR